MVELLPFGSWGSLCFSGSQHLPYYIGIIHLSTSSARGQGLELTPLSCSVASRGPYTVGSLVHVAQEWTDPGGSEQESGDSCFPRPTLPQTCLLALDKSLCHPWVCSHQSLGAFLSLTAYDLLGNTRHNRIHSGRTWTYLAILQFRVFLLREERLSETNGWVMVVPMEFSSMPLWFFSVYGPSLGWD